MLQLMPQIEVLQEALRLAGYEAIAEAALSVIDADPNTPADSKAAIRAMAYKMASFNGGTPEAASILRTVATAQWDSIGITTATALTLQQREAIIGVIVGVSKQVLIAETDRLAEFIVRDTSLPEGWNAPSA